MIPELEKLLNRRYGSLLLDKPENLSEHERVRSIVRWVDEQIEKRIWSLEELAEKFCWRSHALAGLRLLDTWRAP